MNFQGYGAPAAGGVGLHQCLLMIWFHGLYECTYSNTDRKLDSCCLWMSSGCVLVFSGFCKGKWFNVQRLNLSWRDESADSTSLLLLCPSEHTWFFPADLWPELGVPGVSHTPFRVRSGGFQSSSDVSNVPLLTCFAHVVLVPQLRSVSKWINVLLKSWTPSSVLNLPPDIQTMILGATHFLCNVWIMTLL